MKEYYSIGKAAKAVNMTSETLRHYDRIGLVKPSTKDDTTKYRYYTAQDIVHLQTVGALQLMDLSLKEIRQILEYDNLEEIIDFLEQAEIKADEKIEAIQQSKLKIQLAKKDYEKKLQRQQNREGPFIRDIPGRVILLSNTLKAPTIDNFWNYLEHFYEIIDPMLRDHFSFDDLAGIYTEEDSSRLFAQCNRYVDIDGLKNLPAGRYLCAYSEEKDRETVLEGLIEEAKKEYNVDPQFFVQIIVVSGILQWNYQIQIYLGKS